MSIKKGPGSVCRLVSVSRFQGSCLNVFPPWDILRGRDVFVDRVSLSEELGEFDLGHHAPNCATFSRAREIPIRGVRNPPEPLRSEEHPQGIPSALCRLSPKQRKRLQNDTLMADMSATECWKAAERGKGFTLEHPLRSIAMNLPSWVKLLGRDDVVKIEYHTCMFEGSRRKKAQALITNRRHFEKYVGLTCTGSTICDRTGERHLKWRPAISQGKIVQFTTGDEREYPIGFCQAYSRATKCFLSPGSSFCEVFSGPNAPLSHSMAAEHGSVVPGAAITKDGKGHKSELQALADVISKPLTVPRDAKPIDAIDPNKTLAESTFNRLTVLESGKQPSYGKRSQLILDGINDPKTHLSKALELSHPFNSAASLKDDHQNVLGRLSNNPVADLKRRLLILESWKRLGQSQDVLDLQKVHDSAACDNARKLGLKPRTALMARLQDLYSIEDKAVPQLCRQGMPIVGKALESPFFDPFVVPAQITVRELLASARQRRESILKRVVRMAELGGAPLAQAVWDKTIKEVAEGTMGGPFSSKDILARHGPTYNLVPSFGLQQGVNEEGKPKFRRIDDHTAGFNNLAAERRQRIEMANIDYLVVMAKALHKSFETPLLVGSEDMQGAYRQLPLPDKQLGISITAVYDPTTKQPALFEIYGQPFGAGHSVPNFYRCAEWLCRLVVRSLFIMIDHFFDDFFYVCRAQEASNCAYCIQQAFDILGFKLDPKKSQLPQDVSEVLGVSLNLASLHSQRLLLVEPKASRRANLISLICKVEKDNYLPPTLAASIVGKFGFLCSTLFGKVGRCCTASIRARQYSNSSDYTLNDPIKVSLALMKIFVQHCEPRRATVKHPEPPIIIYTDASDVPQRASDRYVLGAVLIDPTDATLEYTYWSVPQDIVDKWAFRETYMSQLEVLAGPLAMATWSKKLHQKQVIHFIDNSSAASTLVKGYSPTVDNSPLIGEYWLTAAKYAIEIYIERVESKSNVADGPSRLEFSLMQSLQARYVSPCTESLHFSLYDFLSVFETIVRC